MKEVTWCRKTVPIKSDKLREYILGAQERIFEVEKVDSLDAKLELYDKSFISLNDALNIIRDDLRQFAVCLLFQHSLGSSFIITVMKLMNHPISPPIRLVRKRI